jgi:hypothetical protein
MSNFSEGYFYNPTRGNITVFQMIDEILRYKKEKPEKFYEIIVGCDSSSGQEPFFPVVVVVLRKGEGGRFFLKRVAYKDRKFYTWKTRILEEVMLSCEFALFLREKLGNQVRYIHADIGENGATKDMIREVTGLIRGNGFEPKIKPESFVASSVADRYS